ncbi:MAG: hypothetical protein KDK39_13725, partial [Leptospiraceae bacterium]|nr:hypothetical protein [Leptospiraceae bacterium]
ENGLYLIRANQSGLSAIYDPKGRLAAGPLPEGLRGGLVTDVPASFSGWTLYQRYGLFVSALLVLLLIGLFGWGLKGFQVPNSS